MSQSGSFSSGGGPFSGLLTLTGDSGGTISGDIAYNINVVGGTDISVVGNSLTNTLTINSTGSSVVLEDQIFYVGKHGNDLNSGRNIGAAVLTFTQAIVLATAALPSASNKIVIECFDDGLYTESITLPAYVSIQAPNAGLKGSIELVDNVSIKFKSIESNGEGYGIIKTSGKPSSYIDIDYLAFTTGTGSISSVGIGNETNGDLYFKFKEIYADGDALAVGLVYNGDNGTIYVDGQTMTGYNYCNFFIWESTGYINGYVNTVTSSTDEGALFGMLDAGNANLTFESVTKLTVGVISGGISSNINIKANKFSCTTAYDMSTGGYLHLTCNELSGDRIGNAYIHLPVQTQIINTAGGLIPQNVYLVNNFATPINLSLPLASKIGDVIELTGLTTSLAWTITQGAGQFITIGATTSTIGVGGSVTSTATGDSIRLICIQENKGWQALSYVGTFTIV